MKSVYRAQYSDSFTFPMLSIFSALGAIDMNVFSFNILLTFYCLNCDESKTIHSPFYDYKVVAAWESLVTLFTICKP